MKVDRSKLKKSSSEVPADCKAIIDTIKGLSNDDLLKELKEIKVWTYGKCELYHWADVLDVFDAILERSCSKETDKKWTLCCDLPGNEQLKQLLLEVLRFTALLIEHSFSRHLYNSMDHLTTLLTSCDMSAVLYVLNLLYVFSKRSNFISRMSPEKKQGLIQRLVHLAESWGGKENGFGLAECCQDLPAESYPPSATTLHFEFYVESKDEKNKKSLTNTSNVIQSIHIEHVDQCGRMPSQLMEDILVVYDVPEEKQIVLFTHIRLACLFSNYEARVHCVQARLQAISILVYSSAIQDNMNVILYPGLIEELVDIVEIKVPALVDIRSAALRTLTSVIHIERNPRLISIIDATGASSYHGFLPVLVRTCIQHMIDPELKPFPQTYATSLFSFLYHLANYENGVEALVVCGMMESLLKVINWYGDGQEHITFVTRAVRVIDLINDMDMAAFQGLGGLQAFINRLEHEVNICREEQPFEITPANSEGCHDTSATPMDVSSSQSQNSLGGEWQEVEAAEVIVRVSAPMDVSQGTNTSSEREPNTSGSTNNKKCKHCFAQRAALLKSMLNFMKKAIPNMSFAESIRHLMDGSLPRSLKHIISNAEYYGPSLFLLATDVVTVYVFQEPSLLSSLQDKGLTDVVLHALLVKDVPATREVLASLPNVFSALCLNARGLQAFVACRPFERLFKVLLSQDYLPAMRRRRSSDPFGDTASNLGTAMDELMRHQPSLRSDATKAIIKLLEEICSMGMDPHFICQKQQPKNESSSQSSVRSPQSNEASSSDEEEEEEVEMPHMPPSITGSTHLNVSNVPKVTTSQESVQVSERQAIPLMDYVLNVMKFVEAILSNNSTDDHCREFVQQKGLKPLMSILSLPNLPIDFPSSFACQAVSSVCKSILSLSREPQVLKQGLLQMNEVLQQLQPLHMPLEAPGGSVLLRELANCAHIPDATLSPTVTPLLHALAAAHAYIMMFVQICRMGQTDIRTISLNHWGSDLGLEVLKGLSSLYNSLVWESTVLLALCNEDYLPADCQFGKADLEKLLSKDAREKGEAGEGAEATDGTRFTTQAGDTSVRTEPLSQNAGNGVSAVLESTSAGEEGMDTSEAGTVAPSPEALAMGASPSQEERQTGGRAQQGEGAQSLNLPHTTVTASSSSTSIDMEATASGVAGQTRTASEKDPKKKVSPAMHAQLRQLKPLLTLSSRLGRALSELFVLLVKLSVGSPVRQRRSQQPPPTPPIPSPAARAVALALTKLLAGGLPFQPPASSPQPKLRMTFLVCSAGFIAPMLFDEKKQPYHLMLQKFVACGGQSALFQSFSWALSIDGKVPLSEGLEHPDLPDGTGEFLDSWLSLVEKMINPKAVLETPHMLPSKGKAPGLTPFSPVQYLISTQKAAFNAVMNLWNKAPLSVNGSRISESVLAILCHIICGETILKKYIEKDKAASASGSGETAVDLSGAGPSHGQSGTSTNSGAGGAATPMRLLEQPVSLSQFDQLIDMGFTREQALEALTNTTTLEQATDYILTHSIPSTTAQGSGGGGGGGSMDVEMDDHNQVMMAIAMSLGENAVMSTDQPKTENKEEKTSAETEEKQEAEEPLDTAVLDDFTFNIFPGCLKLIDALPETVYRVCDLLVVCMHRNGLQWKKDILESVCKDLCELCKDMTDQARNCNLKEMIVSSNAKKFATRLHLLSLLAEEMNRLCAVAMCQANLPSLMVDLLQVSKMALFSPSAEESKFDLTPKWLAPMLLLLDLWEKIAVSIKIKINARIAVGRNRKWKWFDESSGRWNSYAPNNNTTIDEAYKKGDSFVRFQTGRKKYCLQFGTMIQRNEDSGNRRPVMLAVPTAEDKSQGNKDQSKAINDQVADEIKKEFEVSGRLDDFLPGLSAENLSAIVSCLSSFLGIPLLPDCLHAAMRLILRVTRQHQYAVQFVRDVGAQRLLTLTQESNFQGFLNLATLIFRHILEEPVSLRYCMEKVMRNVCAGVVDSCQCGVSKNGVGAKEMHYVLRVLGSAACRNPELFSNVARDTLQIVLPPATARDEDESRYLGPNAPQILKCTPTKQLESLVNPWIKTFIWDLLTALASSPKSKGSKDEPSNQSKDSQQTLNTLAEVLQEFVSEATGQISNNSNFSWPNSSASTAATTTTATDKETTSEKETTAAGGDAANNVAPKPLIPKSAILRLLSEIIRSYGNCVHLITQHAYQPGQSDLITETCSVLAFVLDNLLPNGQEVGDKDCSVLSRVFIASIASCSHSPDAQLALVTEVKSALQRALMLPEGSAKHQRVQALSAIISTMIESCPTPGHMPNQFLKVHPVMNNNMMKILVKKGVLVDLARVPHSLDLSSPFLATTVNAVLKPLETLSRSVNSPDKFVAVKKAGDQTTAPDQGGTTTQVVTEPANQEENAEGEAAATTNNVSQMNVTIEDVTNNLEAQEDLEVTSDNQIAEPESLTQQCELDDVLSQIFQTGVSGNPEDQVISEMTISQEPATGEDESEILIDVEVEGDDDDFDHEHHDSQMVSQVLSDEDGEDGDNDRDHDNQDDVSGDDEDYDEADQEEMGEEDDEEEDEDEEDDEDDDEDDEEASDMDVEVDDYQEICNPFDMDDLMLHMEDFPTRGRHLLFNDNTEMQTYQLPMHLSDNDGAADSMPSLPPAPSLITSTHPLLMRQSDSSSQRNYRGGRSRIRTFPAYHATPLILQRLLGPSTAAEILTLTSTLSSQNAGSSAPTRVVVARDNLPFLQRTDDDFVEDIFQETFSDTSSSGTGALSCIPSTLTRWTEETKVLDGDGVHDLVTVLKPPLVDELVKKRDEELSERKEKRKKMAETSVTEPSKKKEKSDSKTDTPTSDLAGVSCPPGPVDGGVSSTQAAEWLASAMVEQVLSPMVSSSTPTSSNPANLVTIVPRETTIQLSPSSSSLTSSSSNDPLSEQAPPSLSSVVTAATTISAATATTTTATLGNLWAVTLPISPPPMPSPDVPLSIMTHPSSSSLGLPMLPRSTGSSVFADSSLGMPSSDTPFGNMWDQAIVLAQPETPMNELGGSAGRNSGQNSMISQLLDSIIVDTVSSGTSSSTSTSMLPSVGTSSAQLQTSQSANLPFMFVRSDGQGESNVSPFRYFMEQSQSHPLQIGSSLLSTTATSTSAVTSAARTPVTIVTTAGTSPTLFQLPVDGTGAVNSSHFAANPRMASNDLDLSQLFSQPYGSGVTGATPPLSNLSFITTTASTAATTSSPSMTTNVPSTSVPGSSTERPHGETEVPEGVDPSFLAALPEHIRQEVISEQLRLQRIRRRAEEQAQQAQQTASASDSDGTTAMEVNPEFLAALPPAIQEEVLAQQRAEQARLTTQQTTVNPDAPVDLTTFFSTLSSSLRRQVLSDMDDSMLAVLPPELAAEAQEMRLYMERHRRLAGRLGSRFAIRATQRQSHWSFNSTRLQPGSSGSSGLGKVKGRFMLDPEALTCLLVLLFIDEPKLNTTRLHRVLRNLCYHAPTRSWLMKALLSIIQRSGENHINLANALCVEEKGYGKDKGKGKKSTSTNSSTMSVSSSAPSSSSASLDSAASMQSDLGLPGGASLAVGLGRVTTSGFWLSISLEAALGCRANVFQIQRAPGKKLTNSSSSVISIHPQAAPVVCKHALETLISLAKIFPYHFLPIGKTKEAGKSETSKEENVDSAKKSTSSSTSASSSTATACASASQSSPKAGKSQDMPGSSSSARLESKPENDFWNILVRLDNASGKSKGKGVQRNHNLGSAESEPPPSDYSTSPIGQLMSMLNHPVIRRSQVLTDRLLRLLSLVSTNLPNHSNPPSTTATSTSTSSTRTTTTTTAVPAVATTTVSATSTQSTAAPAMATTVSTEVPVAMAAPATADSSSISASQQEATKSKEETVEEKPWFTPIQEEESAIMQDELKLSVEVLTSKSCSEDGLEDATSLLIQLASVNYATCTTILALLLDGACKLGLMVCDLIKKLLDQLVELNSQLPDSAEEESSSQEGDGKASGSGKGAVAKGIIQDRFSSTTSVVVTAPATVKTGRELQLSSMSPLTCKTSCQQFFLRILKVIIQLREIAGPAGSSKKKLLNRVSGHSVLQHINDIIGNMLNDSSVLHVLPAATGPLNVPEAASSDAVPADTAPDTPHVPGDTTADGSEAPMEVDNNTAPGPSKSEEKPVASEMPPLPRLSVQLGLDELWNTLGECLAELARTSDHHAVLILQPTVEAFFLVHAGEKASKHSDQPSSRREDQLAHLNMEMAPPSPAPANASDRSGSVVTKDVSGAPVTGISHLPPDTQKFLKFAETHRPVLNQILRQSTLPLADGPFSVLVDHTRILDFDVKRRYFRQELERMHEGARREDLPVHVRRSHVFEDSFRELFRRSPEEWKQRFYIVFEGEEGQDAGGLLREWYVIISHEIFNQNYALFLTSPGDRVTYSINPSSHCNSNHLSYFKFVGRIIAKAVYDNKLLDCYFTRSFYKHMLGLAVKYTDMESEDYAFYQGLHFLLENNVADLGYDIFFSTEIQEFGVTETRELMNNGSNVIVTEENKREYVKLVCQMKMTGAIRQQLNAFLEGFYDIIPKKLVSIFTEQELELLISGLPTIDIDNLKANTEYNKYQATSLQIQWFWRALRSFDQAERANFLQFVTGTSKVPLGGFSNLEGMNGIQRFQIHRDDRSTDRLPSAHTCFNQLDLPAYETYDKLRKMLLLAVSECSEGFGLA